MGRGAWWAAVHGVAKSRTRLSGFTFTFHFHALEKEMATHSSVLAWRIPGTGEPGGLPSMGSHRVRHDWSNFAVAAAAAAVGGKLLYSVGLVSAIQGESAITIHRSPSSWAPLSSLHPSPLGHQQSQAGLPALCRDFRHYLFYTWWCTSTLFLCSSHSLPPPLGPQVCPLQLCFQSSPANRVIRTILDSIYRP